MALVVDTGPLVAAANRSDPYHPACAALRRAAAAPLVVPALVVAEAGYLIGKHLGATAEAALYRSMTRPRLRVEPVTTADFARMAELVERYADLGLGGTDASVVCVAERLGLDTVATLDRRHFTVIRPGHVPALTLVP